VSHPPVPGVGLPDVPQNDDWLRPDPAQHLSGEEMLTGLDVRVADFWRWAYSDLRSNAVRGVLAEYLVARAVAADRSPRVEWAAYDVLTPSGITVEVKASAYLQSWNQRQLSVIRFTGLTGRTWTPEDGYSEEPTLNAQVYVFCLHTARSHAEYNPLDAGQWQFRVLPASRLPNAASMSLATLVAIAPAAHGWDDLNAAIEAAAHSVT
jgi:hypothetical protein